MKKVCGFFKDREKWRTNSESAEKNSLETKCQNCFKYFFSLNDTAYPAYSNQVRNSVALKK